MTEIFGKGCKSGQVINTYIQINDKYSIITCSDQQKILIDTCFVPILKLSTWYINSEKVYQTKTKREIVSYKYVFTHINDTAEGEYNKIGFSRYPKKNLFSDIFPTYTMDKLIVFLGNLPGKNNDLFRIYHKNRISTDLRSLNLQFILKEKNIPKQSVRTTELPIGITSLPKFMIWQIDHETTKCGNNIIRKYFKIENHPQLKYDEEWGNYISWVGNKKQNIHPLTKFKEAMDQYVLLEEKNETDQEKLFEEYNILINFCINKDIDDSLNKNIDFTKEKLNIISIPNNDDYILICHGDVKVITNSKFYQTLKEFSIYSEHNDMIVNITKYHIKYNLICKKANLSRVIMHLAGQFCENNNKKLKYTCHKNGILGDCRIENLYWGSKTEQQMCKDTKLISNLPNDCVIQPENIPKYIYYHAEPREYFFITHHPALDEKQKIVSSSSNNSSISEKYQEILEKLGKLNAEIPNDVSIPDFITRYLLTTHLDA